MEKIHPTDLWQHLTDRILIDVRSPSEYARAHIPNALSLPLFNDAERAKVGTIYKQTSPESALIKGLEIVGPKMSGFVKKAIKWSPNRKVIVHCWRGGKRSGSVAWLLKFAGFDVLTVEGGYKKYRQTVLESFDNLSLTNIVVLGGKTGSGKTHILHELKKRGEQIIDLEGLAQHKGSAFGWIGENDQPTTEQFENDLHATLRQIDPTRRVWIENESRSVGKVFIPEGFWTQMRAAPLVQVEVPFEVRVQHLVNVYGVTEKSDLAQCFEKIKKKIGFDQAKFAIKAVESGALDVAARIALTYYDKAYNFCFETNETPQKHVIAIDVFDAAKTADKLIDFAKEDLKFKI
ncbi:MAG: tRNA 2-selenouridine(34) synthase MnmH [Saprospiraceae bacterium]|nr:tRNA 2-selenouridine(34) synthase MnmH [Saprospiraceae bacterium]